MVSPPVPVEAGRLLLQPVPVDFGVRRQVFEALVTVQDLFLLLRVQVVDGGKAEPGSQRHLDGAAHFTYVEDLDDCRATMRLLFWRRLDHGL